MAPLDDTLMDFAPALLMSSADAMAVVGENSCISSCNAKFLEVLSVSHERALSLDCHNLFPDLHGGDGAKALEDDFQPVRMVLPDGLETWVLMKAIPVLRDGEQYRLVLIQDPVTARRIVDRLDYVEDHDPATGLYSRRRGIQELRNMAASEPQGCCLLSVIKSKTLDIVGRLQMESLMQQVIDIYRDIPDFDPIISRINTNELMLISPNPESMTSSDLAQLKFKLNGIVPEGSGIYIATGMSTWDEKETPVVSLLDEARLDQLSGQTSRHAGVHDDALLHSFLTELRTALVYGQMEFYIQPQMHALSGEMIGGELLIRWNHPEHGLIPPGQFIEHLEDGLFSEEFANWSIIEATKVAIELKELLGRWFPLSLNIAAPQFTSRFAKTLEKTIDFRDIPHACLEVEITERLLAEDPSRTLETLNEIRDMGFKIAIDDFGTGYSSLSYIRRFPLDRLKIDRAFVVNLAESEEDRLIATAIASLAHVLGLEIIAEGVETPEQAAFLKSIDCEFFQGYIVSKPMPLAEFAQFVQSRAQKTVSREQVDLKVFSTVEDRAIKPVSWKRSFSTDVTSVDDEHRVLVDMLNDLTDQLLDPETDVDIEAALNDIGKETLQHFAHEERVMENIHYDRVNSHRQKHQDLIADFTRRREELLTAFRDGELVELVNYLKFWLLRHLISEDTRLHRFLNHHPGPRA